jgi:hypothetical protein
MEAAIGFEPMHGGFADLSLNHLGTPPQSRSQSRLDPFNYHARESASIEHPHAHAVAWPVPILVLFLGRREPLWLEGDSNGL